MAAPPDAATAELQTALERCCAQLAAALEAEEGAPATSDGAVSSSAVAAAEAETLRWRPLVLGTVPGLEQLVSIVKPPLQVIIAVLQFVQALLKTLAAILIGILDPFRALILAAYALLTDIINDLLGTGAYMYVDAPGIFPTEMNLQQSGIFVDPPREFRAGQALQPPPVIPGSFDRWASRFAASFDDPGDDQRPTVTQGAPVQAVFIVMAAPSLEALRQALYLLGKLFNIDAFKVAFEKYAKGSPDPRRSRARSKPVAPDWRAARLVDLFPPLKELSALPEALLGLLMSIDQLSQLLRDLANAMQEKAAVLMKLAEAVQAIIDLLEALKSAGMYVLPVATTGGVNDLKTAFVRAQNRPPGGYVGGVCLLASGPNLAKATMLWELLGASSTMDAMQGKLSLSDLASQLQASALGEAATILEASGEEIADAAGQLKTKAAASGEALLDAVKSAPGDFVHALGQTPAELEQLAKTGRAELVGMLEDAESLLSLPDEDVLKAIEATNQARRRGARSLALGFGMPGSAAPPAVPPADAAPPPTPGGSKKGGGA